MRLTHFHNVVEPRSLNVKKQILHTTLYKTKLRSTKLNWIVGFNFKIHKKAQIVESFKTIGLRKCSVDNMVTCVRIEC